MTDISSEAVELTASLCRKGNLPSVAVLLRAQAERIKELEDDLVGMRAEGQRMRREVDTARNDALAEAVVKCQAEVTAARENGCEAQAMGAMWCKKAVFALIEGGTND